MPRLDYKTCRGCGRHVTDAGLLSRTRLCRDCWTRRLNENIDGLHTHSGPALLRWRRGMAASSGAILIDDLEALAGNDG